MFRARAPAGSFSLDLTFEPTQPAMVNGDRGYSRKGPKSEQASYYYSMPQLTVRGTVVKDGRRVKVKGRGWLDREWSSTLLDPEAVGWDWAGINLDDGGALLLFPSARARRRWAVCGRHLRRADGSKVVLGPDDVRFVPGRRWRSPLRCALSGGGGVRRQAAEGKRRFPLKPLFDAQELDGRAVGMPAYLGGCGQHHWRAGISRTDGICQRSQTLMRNC
jgi:hypothetical protein